MIKRIAYILLLVALLSSAGYAADELAITVSLDRDSIGLDEQATLTVNISGMAQNLPDPRMPTLPMFEVYSQGRSSNIQIIQGQVNSSVTYRYLILPKKAGTFPIDQIATVYKNKRYKGNKVELTVLQSGTATPPSLSNDAQSSEGKSKDYFFNASVDNSKPYVNQQITLTLKFYLAVQNYGSLDLTGPTTTGFWMEKIGNKAPYFQKINNRNYKVYEIKYALFPTQTGKLEIGRAMIRTTVASRKKRNQIDDMFGNFFGAGEDVSIRSNVVNISVKPLPDAGRPKDFTGTIGKFIISAKPSKQKVDVNQPVTVSIRISGTGNIKSVSEPIIPEMNEQFRIYKASSSENITKLNDRIGGSKIFEEVFIPKNPGSMEIPALKYNFFDPSDSKYKEISTRPIKLTVNKPAGYVGSVEVPYAAPDLTIGSQARDIRYIKKDIGDLNRENQLIITNPFYLMVNGLPLMILLGLVVNRRRKEKIQGDVGYARSRAAAKEAKKRLTKAQSIAKTESAAEFYQEISTVLTSYVADKLNISPYGLTSDKLKNFLLENKADEELIDRIISLLEQSDFARFAPSTVTQNDIDESFEQATDIMVKVYEIKFD